MSRSLKTGWKRAFGTLQDWLVKELRLANITTAAANACSPKFIADYNQRFVRTPLNAKDLHRPLRPQTISMRFCRRGTNRHAQSHAAL